MMKLTRWGMCSLLAATMACSDDTGAEGSGSEGSESGAETSGGETSATVTVTDTTPTSTSEATTDASTGPGVGDTTGGTNDTTHGESDTGTDSTSGSDTGSSTGSGSESSGTETGSGSSSSSGDATVLSIDEVQPGELVITEIMYDSVGSDREWIEVFNTLDDDVDLLGLEIRDSTEGNVATIENSVILPAGGYGAISVSGEWSYGDPVLAELGAPPMFNNSAGGDLARIANASGDIDVTASYSPPQGDPDTGFSFKLLPSALDAVSNDDAANWCYEVPDNSMGTAQGEVEPDHGTPGRENGDTCNML